MGAGITKVQLELTGANYFTLASDRTFLSYLAIILKKPSATKTLCLAIIVFLPLLILPPTALADSDQEQAAKQELKQVKKRIDKLKKVVSRTKTKRSKTEKALKAAEVKIGSTSKQLRKVNQDIKSGQKKLKKLSDEKGQLKVALSRQQNALGDDIRTSYMQGRQEYVKLLLNQEQPEKLARTLRYYDYFHRSRSARIQEFSATLDNIERVTVEINEKKIHLGQLRDRLNDQKLKLQSAQKERKKVLVVLDKELAGSGNKLSKLVSDEQELQALLDAVQQTLDDLPPDIGKVKFRSRKGLLPWPVKGKVAKRFGSRKHRGKMRWKGMVINASNGTDVRAIHHGRVIFSDWMRGTGLLIIIDHGEGYFSLYGHNETLLRDTGDWINAGDVIASVGNSGGQAKSGLYFEIREAGKPANPAHWIAKK